jgi:arginyl-tRNA synthetase
MYAKQEALKEIVAALKKSLGKKFSVSLASLATPPNQKFGDVAFGCFELAKGEKRNPVELATELAAKIEPGKLFERVVAVGPYVNFTFNEVTFFEKVFKDVKRLKLNYGQTKLGDGKSVLVEYAQPNTHKEFHVGHVRNALYGQAVVNIMRKNGYATTAASYLGDIGAHVAKALWGLKKFHDGSPIPVPEREKKLGAIYTKATKYVEDHPKAKEQINEVQRALEAGEEPWFSLWKETRQWSIDAFKKIFAELLVEPDVYYFESDVEAEGKKLVNKLLTDGVAKKSEGAVIVDLEAEGLGAALILKSDGSALYATKDIPLALRKEKDFHPDRQIIVVDVRQSLYFQQLFAILRKMGFTKQLTHLAYDMVTLPDGAMSSRQGNIVTYETLRDAMIESFTKETAGRHEDWSEKKIKETAQRLAISSIKFMMLRQDPQSILTFDLQEAMSFDGFTGPYVLYAVARIESLKAKTKIKAKADLTLLKSPEELALLRAVAEWPLVVERLGASFQISAGLQWAFETSKLFAEYYSRVTVIDEADKSGTAARLALLDVVETAIVSALMLAGIEPLKEM